MSFCKRFIDFVKVFPVEKWDWLEVSRNINTKMDDIRDNMHLPWNWRYGVSSNPNLDLDMIRDFPYYDWDKALLSKFIPLNVEIIKLLNNRKKKKIKREESELVNWYPYSFNNDRYSIVNICKIIKLEDIADFKRYFKINYQALSMNKNINIRFILANSKKKMELVFCIKK